MIKVIALVLLLTMSFTLTPAYRIHQTYMNLRDIRTVFYGNYRPDDSRICENNQRVYLSGSINKVIQFYNKKPLTFRWQQQYSIEFFQDSSMSAVAQILYRKVNLTHTYRYYSLRPRKGPLANKTFFLGTDVCQSCNPGRDMPFMAYKSLDIQSEQNLAFEFVNIVNSAKKMSWNVEDIKEVRHWQFPEGDFYLPVFKFTNESTYMGSFMKSTSQPLTFIEGTFFPKFKGNVPIDQPYLYEYLIDIYDDRKIKFPTLLHSNIVYFQYYVDPVDKHATTVMLNIINDKSYYQTFGVFHQRQFNYIYHAQYNKAQLMPYFSSPFFLQDTQNNRMSSTITQQEYKQLGRQNVTHSSLAKILQARYIDYPFGTRQYMLTISYNSSISNRTVLKYLLRPNIAKFSLTKQVYSRTMIYSYASPYSWEETWPKIYEYGRQYGTIHDQENFAEQLTGVTSTQICELFSDRFQGAIWRISPSNSPKLKRLFLKDTETNRVFLILDSSLRISQQRGPNFSFCPSINIQIIDPATFDRIYNAISGQLVNVDGEAFLIEEMKEQLLFRLNVYGGNNVYYISFEKNGIKSAFYINQTKKGTLTIFDYIENVEQTGANSYPNLGSDGNNNSTTPTTPITPSTPTNTSKNITSNTTTPTPTPTPNQTIPNASIPKPQIILPTISDIIISGEGTLSAQDIINRYNILVSIIKNYDASANLQKKPFIFVYCDRYNKIISYAMAYIYSNNIYELYQLIEMVESKQYFYAGKTYLTNLPSSYWSASENNNQEVMQQAFAIVNTNPAVANVPILKGTVKSIATLKGGIFFVNMTITNGYTVNMAFLRKQIVWEKVYAYFIPPSSPNPPSGSNNQDNNNPNPGNVNSNLDPSSQNNKPILTEMTDSQIRSDTFLLAGFALIKDNVSQLMSGLGLSQAMKGSFSNGTLVYNLTYRSLNSSIYLNIIFYYDPINSKVIYLKTEPSAQPTPLPAAVGSPTDQEMQKIVMDNTLANYPQLSSYQSASIQWSKFPSFWICNVNLTVNGMIYYRIVQISIPSMQVLQLKFAKGGL